MNITGVEIVFTERADDSLAPSIVSDSLLTIPADKLSEDLLMSLRRAFKSMGGDTIKIGDNAALVSRHDVRMEKPSEVLHVFQLRIINEG